MIRQIDIIVPDLLAALVGANADSSARAVLGATLARADQTPGALGPGQIGDHAALINVALPLTGLRALSPGSLPPAGITAAWDFPGIDTDSSVLRADPVYLRADVSRIALFDAATIGFTASDAAALLSLLNDSFAAEGLHFTSSKCGLRWYLHGTDGAALAARAPRDLHGQALEPDQATRRDLGALKRVMTEAQMLLHDCDLNVTRAAAGLAPINSIWIWRGAPVERTAVMAADRVYSDDDEILACVTAGGHGSGLPLAQFMGALDDGAKRVAVVCSPQACTAALDDVYATLLAPALAAVDAGAAERVVITAAGGRFDLTRGMRWRRWRRPRVLFARWRALFAGGALV